MKILNYQDKIWMTYAFILAQHAEIKGEVPVGAILVFNNYIIGSGFNCSIKNHDPTAHAEIVALREGGKILKNYRLINTTLYVTIEPCMMCLGAIINSRINNLVIGTKYSNIKKKIYNFKNILQICKKKINIRESILNNSCSNLIKNFFKKKRHENHLIK